LTTGLELATNNMDTTATVKEIAAHLDLSESTVARVLGNRGQKHSPSTRARVMRHATELGYRPNSSAIAIGSGRFHCATLLIGTDKFKNNVPDQQLAAIHDVLDESDYHLNIARLSDERMVHETAVPKFLRQWMTDGILINYTSSYPEQLVESLSAAKVPAVWVNSKHDGDCVYPDDLKAGYDCTMRLLELGHQNIAYCLGYTTHYSATDRYLGYCKAMEAAGLPCWRVEHRRPPTEWPRFARDLCAAPDCPTAFVTYDPEIALAISYSVQQEGRRVPEDVSIVTFSGAPVINYATGQLLTTCLVPEHEVGRRSARMLLKKIEAPTELCTIETVPFTYTEDYSTAERP